MFKFFILFSLILMLAASSAPARAQTTNGLQAWWKLDEGIGGSTVDATGNGHNGTLVSSPAWVDGKYGAALLFDGATNYVDTDNFADNLTEMTVTCWFNTSASISNDAAVLVSKISAGGTWGGTGWMLALLGPNQGAPGSLAGIVENGSNYYVPNSDASFADGMWHQAAMVVTGGNAVVLYIDGAIPAGALYVNGSIATYTNAGNVRIGYDYGGPNPDYFPGIIDEVRIYDRALTPGEIYELYENGTHSLGLEF